MVTDNGIDQGLMLIGITSTQLLVDIQEVTYELLFLNLSNGNEVRLAVSDEQVAHLAAAMDMAPPEDAPGVPVQEVSSAAPQSVGPGSVADVQSI